MNRYDVATLGIRFAALYALFEALEYFSNGFVGIYMMQSAAFGGKTNITIGSLVFFLPSALLAVTGILVLTQAPRLADYLLPRSGETTAIPIASSGATPCVGFGIVGLAGCIYSAPRLVPIVVGLFQPDQFGVSHINRGFMLQLPQILGIAFQLLLSFVILVKSRALAAWWQRKQAALLN